MTPNGKIKFREDYWNGLHRENLFQEILFFSGFFLCVLLLRLSSCTMRTKNRKIKLRLTFGFVRFLGGSKGNIEEKIWYKEKWVWQSAKHKNKNPKTGTKYVGQSWRNVMMKKKNVQIISEKTVCLLLLSLLLLFYIIILHTLRQRFSQAEIRNFCGANFRVWQVQEIRVLQNLFSQLYHILWISRNLWNFEKSWNN